MNRFVWGVSTAAYQIEGAATEGGRGVSVWDTFCAEPGRIADGGSGAVACDHYHRYAEDLDLVAGLGADAYRFSIAWPRIQPDGRGPANAAGLDFYDRLVDAALERGIAPVPTLYHWDLPQPLEDDGGWMNRTTAQRFAEYAGIVAQSLGDRVAVWGTLNEPFVQMALGYGFGVHAPGRTHGLGSFAAGHHQLLAHGLGTQAVRAHSAAPVMLVNTYSPVRPASDAPGDERAASAYDLFHNKMFTDPLLTGDYPAALLETPGIDPGVVHAGDLAQIAQPLDRLGVNYYQPTVVRAPGPENPLPFEPGQVEGVPTTGFGWAVVPSGLRDLLVLLRDRYGDALPPVLVTENGCSYPDVVGPDGAVDDSDRVAYLDAHIGALREAVDTGVDVRGYFVWSLVDNFEWAEGYTQRFGLVHVDYDTQARTPKASYAWYRDRIAR
ncbi:MAG: GH1 family beta-glucosidase [Nocardioidaceae bacterium]